MGDSTIPSIATPITYLNYLSKEDGRHYEITRNVEVAFVGAAVFELLDTITADYNLLRKQNFRPVLLAYLFSRPFALLYSLLSILEKSGIGVSCEALHIAKAIFGILAITTASFLFLRRVQAIWTGYPIVIHAFSLLWLISAGLTILIIKVEDKAELADTGYCVIVRAWTTPVILTAIANPVVFDTSVFVFISYRIAVEIQTTDGIPAARLSWDNIISGRALPRLSRAVLRGGQQYYLIVLLFNVFFLIFILAPTISPQLKTLFSAPTILVTAIMACRVYRGLRTEARLGNTVVVPELSLRFREPTSYEDGVVHASCDPQSSDPHSSQLMPV